MLLRSLIALLIIGIVVAASTNRFLKKRTLGSSLQLVGAGSLTVMALTHLFEALELFPWMNWGRDNSIGHYVDLGSAVLGLTLFSAGYFIHAFARRRP